MVWRVVFACVAGVVRIVLNNRLLLQTLDFIEPWEATALFVRVVQRHPLPRVSVRVVDTAVVVSVGVPLRLPYRHRRRRWIVGRLAGVQVHGEILCEHLSEERTLR